MRGTCNRGGIYGEGNNYDYTNDIRPSLPPGLTFCLRLLGEAEMENPQAKRVVGKINLFMKEYAECVSSRRER